MKVCLFDFNLQPVFEIEMPTSQVENCAIISYKGHWFRFQSVRRFHQLYRPEPLMIFHECEKPLIL